MSGSGDVIVRDDALHVGRDRNKTWWVVGHPEGSYGGSTRRSEAIKIAIDTSATGFHGKRRIVVHHYYGGVAFVITRVRQRPSSQFFQDSVP
jgi:hypothetical protein